MARKEQEMKTKYVKMNELSKIYMFADLALRTQTQVLVRRGVFCVDGSSVLGLLAINMSEGAIVEYDASAVEFENFISQFEIEC